METEFLPDAAAIAARIPDGALIGLPPDYSLPAMEVVRSLIRKKSKGLRLLGVPQLGLCADLLVGAGCVAEIDTSAVTLGEAGLAPRFTDAVENKKITMRDATCPAIHTALQAAEKGVPFMPIGGIIGSDLVKGRKDWKIERDPFSGDEILLVKALRPDVALFHARWADEAGNVWIGRRKEVATIAHASRQTFVTFEELKKGNMLEDELLAPGLLSSVYVTAVAPAKKGAWPLGVADVYGIDDAHVQMYAKMAKTQEGFSSYLQQFVS